MGFLNKRHDEKPEHSKQRRGLKYVLLHSPIGVGGLVLIAILSSVLVYAQTGLLFRPEPVNQSYVTEIEDTPKEENTLPADEAKPSLEKEAEVVAPPKPKTQAATTKETPKPRTQACDRNSSEHAKKLYERALKNQERLLKKRLSKVNGLSKLFSPLFGDKSEAERRRYDEAIKRIASDYRQALRKANCNAD